MKGNACNVATEKDLFNIQLNPRLIAVVES